MNMKGTGPAESAALTDACAGPATPHPCGGGQVGLGRAVTVGAPDGQVSAGAAYWSDWTGSRSSAGELI